MPNLHVKTLFLQLLYIQLEVPAVFLCARLLIIQNDSYQYGGSLLVQSQPPQGHRFSALNMW